ncbi:chemotaxis protein CheB [Dyella nitratireducens]|uniref:protein-glutamate methylesterase n=1 Tax=Dyella nitratireducens TaxID=1849580 RepID=A0ABQ1FPX7_9GAMM|nr:chemotaxis protein CheB [Dyella nitratireducens]GGA25195.1 chemotaxis protein CheB [Dyella nitratireducens]GLQ43722.1 chemotaxis protein CheB [Dyella nitratireducens]
MNVPAAIAIGCSAGGVDALMTLLGGLHVRLPQPVLVCCHRSDTMDILSDVLGRASALPVRDAIEREPVQRSVVYLAPAGYHLLVERDLQFALSADARVNYARPSIDVLFYSAAEAWRQALVGVILTGANADGAAGLRRIRQLGGIAVVQSPADAEATAMPQAALDTAGADYCLPLTEIAPLLNQLCLI